jgi:hypothetical protein
MKLLAYYLQITLPIGVLLWLSKINSPILFVAGLLIYVLIYRPIVDYFRLLELGIVKKRTDFLKILFPYFTTKYFYDLYFRVK